MFSFYTREVSIATLDQEVVDVLVIGGGITGAGIALDAISRGLSVALLEQRDFGSGTSSRSTKLIHGGLRYLFDDELDLVAESGSERVIVYRNAPHVTRPLQMLMPLYEHGLSVDGAKKLLNLYDYLAGVDEADQNIVLSREEALMVEPLLPQEGLIGAGYYSEYATNDARLTIEVIKKAQQLGAMAVNYAQVEKFVYTNDQISGAIFTDGLTGKKHGVAARAVVNATGVWIDEVRKLDKNFETPVMQGSKGVHLVFSKTLLSVESPLYFANKIDGLMIFIIPREDDVYVGTTDTQYDGDVSKPDITQEDVDYLLTALNANLNLEVEITTKDVLTGWSGIRPLVQQPGKDTTDISRREELFVSPTGLISMAGGKLTGYRKMAEKAVDAVFDLRPKKAFEPCQTETLKLAGGSFTNLEHFNAYQTQFISEMELRNMPKKDAIKMVGTYGSEASQVATYYFNTHRESNLSQYDYATLLYGIDHEAVIHPLDFLERRSNYLFESVDATLEIAGSVLLVMKDIFHWNESQLKTYLQDIKMAVQQITVK